MTLKIAVVASGNIPSKWANSINTMRHANAFNQLGHNVRVISVLRYMQKKELQKISSLWDYYGVDPMSIFFEKDQSLNYFNAITFVRFLTRVLNKLSFGRFAYVLDPELSISNKLSDQAVDFCYARSYRVVGYNIENKIPTIMETHNSLPEKSKDLMAVLRQSNSSYLVSIVTIHEKIKAKLIALGVEGSKVIVLEDAVDKERFDAVTNDKVPHRKIFGIPKDRKVVGYLGSLKPGKAIHKILETARLCKNPDVLFVIAGGEQAEVDRWKENALYRKENTLFLGFLEGKYGPAFLKACDILFMPYDLKESGTVMDLETTSPIKLFEYMAAKRPIVTTKIPVIEKVLEDFQDGVLVSDNDYMGAISMLIENEKFSSQLAENALAKSARFTYVERCKKILASLNQYEK